MTIGGVGTHCGANPRVISETHRYPDCPLLIGRAAPLSTVMHTLDRAQESHDGTLIISGRVFPSNAVLDGKFVLRACIVNFRTAVADTDALIEQTVEKGASLHAQSSVTARG